MQVVNSDNKARGKWMTGEKRPVQRAERLREDQEDIL